MSKPNLKTDQSGFVLVAAVMILLIVVMIGIFATDTAIFETKIAGYDKAEKVVFYEQESCLTDAKLTSTDWLTVAFLNNGTTDAGASFPTQNPYTENDNDDNGINDDIEAVLYRDQITSDGTSMEIAIPAGFQIRNLTDKDIDPDDNKLSKEANNIPKVRYIDSPPPGTGFSPRDFEARKFAITCTPPRDQTTTVILQEGTYRIFNKFEK